MEKGELYLLKGSENSIHSFYVCKKDDEYYYVYYLSHFEYYIVEHKLNAWGIRKLPIKDKNGYIPYVKNSFTGKLDYIKITEDGYKKFYVVLRRLLDNTVIIDGHII